jgi:hypothetical protein
MRAEVPAVRAHATKSPAIAFFITSSFTGDEDCEERATSTSRGLPSLSR